MAELIANWLNNEIELSGVSFVVVITRPFPILKTTSLMDSCWENYFISLTSKVTLQNFQKSKFNCLTARETRQAKIDNFTRVEPTLRNLKVKFDAKTIKNIMDCKRGEALKLIYQIKMALEKVTPPTDIAVVRNSKNSIFISSWQIRRHCSSNEDHSCKTSI